MQVSAKIVYYGPGLCGKTTNLHQIHKRTDPDSRGEMVSLETEADRTLFFDLLPLEVGTIGGMRVRLQLYTVPGQVFYNTTRKLVLKGVDGIVFVADSQEVALEANIESFHNLKQNLEELNQPLDKIPFVFQYNKRDLRNILPVEAMDRHLNHDGYDVLEGAALHSVGVFETLKTISKKTLAAVHRKISGTEADPVLIGASSREPAAQAPPETPTDKTLVGAHVPLPVIDVDESARDEPTSASAAAEAEADDVDQEVAETVEVNRACQPDRQAATRPRSRSSSPRTGPKRRPSTPPKPCPGCILCASRHSRRSTSIESCRIFARWPSGPPKAKRRRCPKAVGKCWSKGLRLSKSQPKSSKKRRASSWTSSSWVTTPTTRS